MRKAQIYIKNIKHIKKADFLGGGVLYPKWGVFTPPKGCVKISLIASQLVCREVNNRLLSYG